MPAQVCPICGCGEFVDFNGRTRIHCQGCGSLERGRQMWLVLERCVALPTGASVAHFAPEAFMMDRFASRTGIRYRAFDKYPEHYGHPDIAAETFDLCADTGRIGAETFDLIIHNHVLEHLPCGPEAVLLELKRMLKPGGAMLFSVPIVGETSMEGLDPATTAEERLMRAAQGEHLRIFGKTDFPAMLRRVLGDECLVRQLDHFSADEIAAANIPPAGREPNGKSIFLYRKR